MSEIDTYVKDRLDDQIGYFGKAATREQRRGKLWQNILIGSAAATPLLIGLAEIVGPDLDDWLRAGSLITAALAAVSTSVLAARRYWENGVLYRAREQALIRERNLWEQRAGAYAPDEQDPPDTSEQGEKARRDKLLIESVEAIVAEDVTNWTTRMKEATRRLEN